MQTQLRNIFIEKMVGIARNDQLSERNFELKYLSC